jgi:hypothetical protein
VIDLSPLHLDEASHTYTWQGQPVPGVTSILDRLGYLRHVPRDILTAALARGTRVHKACELDDLGDLDEDAAADVMGYVRAWRSWSEDYSVTWTLSEQPLYHRALRYAGKPDRLGYWHPHTANPRSALVDIKSGPFHPVMDAQLAAYDAMAQNAREFIPADRLLVHLSSDGTYRTNERTEAQIQEGWTLFVSLLSVHNWTMKNL